MKTETVTLEDLWPGDIIVVRRSGDNPEAHRFIDALTDDEQRVIIELFDLKNNTPFKIPVPGWFMPVVRCL